jgi:hypothetical protein
MTATNPNTPVPPRLSHEEPFEADNSSTDAEERSYDRAEYTQLERSFVA